MSSRAHDGLLRRVSAAALGLALLAAGPPAAGHPLAPSLFELRETGAGAFDVRWKTPSLAAPGVRVAPRLPAGCTRESEPAWSREGTGVVERFGLRCPDGIVGRTLRVEGLEASGTDALVHLVLSDGRSFRAILTGARPEFVVPERERASDVLRSYFRLGGEHILTGFDHLVFVFGLLLLCGTRRALVATLTAFTLGHSVTLSLAALGLVHVPIRPLEALIALSIVALGVELVRSQRGSGRAPWAFSCGFGLLHGLGFAGALAAVGLPAGAIPLALLSFNLGIEAGQLAFVSVLLAGGLVVAPVLSRVALRPWLAPYAVGSLGVFWLLQRLWV